MGTPVHPVQQSWNSVVPVRGFIVFSELDLGLYRDDRVPTLSMVNIVPTSVGRSVVWRSFCSA